VGVTLEQDEQRSLIRLEGSIDIGCAAELKALLVQAIQSGVQSGTQSTCQSTCQPSREVRVQQEAATDLDVTAAQLLWAAQREAKNAGVAFTFAGETPEAAWAALANAGIQRFTAPAEVA